jgi:hypothetical protein
VTEVVGDDVFAPPRANLDVREGPEALWEMPFKELRKLYLASLNIRALGALYGLGMLEGLVILADSPANFLNARDLPNNAGIVPVAFFAVFTAMALAGCVSSYSRPNWGRWIGIVLCAISLLLIPIGTAIGIMGLIAYAQGGKLFGPGRLGHKDVAAVYRQRKVNEK